AARLEGFLAQVAAVEKRRVEEVVDDVVAAADVEGILQGLKVRNAVIVVDYHFTVQPAVVQRQGGKCFDLPGKPRRPVLAVAGDDPYLAIPKAGQQPVTIELDFVKPSPGRQVAHEGGELRFQNGREGRIPAGPA